MRMVWLTRSLLPVHQTIPVRAQLLITEEENSMMRKFLGQQSSLVSAAGSVLGGSGNSSRVLLQVGRGKIDQE